MSVDNTITRGGRDVEAQAEQPGFQIPSELRKRYDVRILPGNDAADRRIGLFLTGDRENPSIEISGNGDRIVARREDPETVAALVTIAKHNGWEGIEVDGSPGFRKAVWAAGTREGLVVRGYEPEFAELAQMDKLRREDTERRKREAAPNAPVVEPAPEEPGPNGAKATGVVHTAGMERSGDASTERSADGDLSHDDQRLLLTLSAYTRDRKALLGGFHDGLSPVEATVQAERIDINQERLDAALNQALKSETLVNSLKKAGYEPDELRRMAAEGLWDKDIALAIDHVGAGSRRDAIGHDPSAEDPAARFLVDRWDPALQEHVLLGKTNSPSQAAKLFSREPDTRIIDQEGNRTVGYAEWVNDGSFPRWRLNPAMEQLIAREHAGGEAVPEDPRMPVTERSHAPEDRQHSGDTSARRTEGDELAELFLNGPPERLAAEPRLANAVEAQAAMERHLVEVFDGDRSQTSAAALESRQMISDVLRRGLDVSVREPTPVRQIEPPQIAPDLER